MSERRFAIRSSRVVLASGDSPGSARVGPATVIVQGEKIAEVIEPRETGESGAPSDCELIDGGNLVLMSGIVDTHAHINEPGRTDWEGFQSATRAAAVGGITTVIDMPLNSIPATTSARALRMKAETAQDKCSIDYGFWGGIVPSNAGDPREIEEMLRQGVMGFKAFLCPSGVDEFPMSSEADLRRAMPVLARLGAPLLVHAELETPLPAGALTGDKRAYATYLQSRPRDWELRAIRMMIGLSRETGCHVHIVHLSAADALEDLRQARSLGIPITAETCPHYLHFEAEGIGAGATPLKCSPPIRDHRNREALWRGIQNGLLDFVVSDHSPCTAALKCIDGTDAGDFSRAWGGIAGLQFSMPVVWSGMRARGMSLIDLTRLMSLNTARFAGLERSKGQIAPGFDADLVLWDPERSFRVERPMILHKNKITPYEGAELFGVVERTFVRGHCVHGGDPASSAPIGRKLARSSARKAA